MWDFAKFIIRRVKLRDFVMWLIFTLLSYMFIPSAWVLAINSRTPAHFPDWLNLSDISLILFGLICSLLMKSFLKILSEYKETKEIKKEIKVVNEHLSTMSAAEIAVVREIIQHKNEPTLISNTPVAFSLEYKGIILNIIQIGYTPRYILTPVAEQILAHNFALREPKVKYEN
ncbi:MAG: super-infection exclusion protein B [Pasteurellaceae bacterium]|nr:super-infection exclusion protein B [Pasteurellaceae bacterium]